MDFILYFTFFLLHYAEAENHCGTLAFFRHKETVDLRQHVNVHLNFSGVKAALSTLNTQTTLVKETVGTSQIDLIKADQRLFQDGEQALISSANKISGYYFKLVTDNYSKAYDVCGAAGAQVPTSPASSSEHQLFMRFLKQNDIVYQPFAIETKSDGIYSKLTHQKILHKDPAFTTTEISSIIGINVNTKKWAAPASDTGKYICVAPKASRFHTPLSMEHFLAQVKLLQENIEMFNGYYEKFVRTINLPNVFSSEVYTIAPALIITELSDHMEELGEQVNSEIVTFPLLERLDKVNSEFLELFQSIKILDEKSLHYRLQLDEVAALGTKLNLPSAKIDTQVIFERLEGDEFKVGYIDRAHLVQAKVYDIMPYPDSAGRFIKDKTLVKIGETSYTTTVTSDFAHCEEDEISTAKICSESPFSQERNYDCGAHVWSMRPAEESIMQCDYSLGENPYVITETCGSNKAQAVTLVNPVANKFRIDCPGEPTNPIKVPIGRFDLPGACQVMTDDKVIYKPRVHKTTFTRSEKDSITDFYRQAKLALEAAGIDWEEYLPYTLGGGIPGSALVVVLLWCMYRRKRNQFSEVEQGEEVYSRTYDVPMYEQPRKFIYRSPMSLN